MQTHLFKSPDKTILFFDSIKSKVKLPDVIDPSKKQAEKEQLKVQNKEKLLPQWKSEFKTFIDENKSVKFKVPYKDKDGKDQVQELEFGFEDSFIKAKEKDLSESLEVLASGGVELTKEVVAKVRRDFTNMFYVDYFNQNGDVLSGITKLLTKHHNDLWNQFTGDVVRNDTGIPEVHGKEKPADRVEKSSEKELTDKIRGYLKKKQAGKI